MCAINTVKSISPLSTGTDNPEVRTIKDIPGQVYIYGVIAPTQLTFDLNAQSANDTKDNQNDNKE